MMNHFRYIPRALHRRFTLITVNYALTNKNWGNHTGFITHIYICLIDTHMHTICERRQFIFILREKAEYLVKSTLQYYSIIRRYY